MRVQSLKSLLAPAVAALIGLAAVGTARAAAYVGEWDPAYGSPFTTAAGYPFDLGWRGKAFFDVPDVCLPGGTGYSLVQAGSCGATATSAFVEFYDVAAPGTTLETLNWNGPPNTVGALNALLFKDNVLIGFDTDDSSRQASTLNPPASPPGLSSPIYFDLRLEFQQWDPSPLSDDPTYDPGSYNGPTLSWHSCDFSECYGSGQNDRNFPITFTVSQLSPIPEPGGWALASAGLLVVAWRHRRRSQRAVPRG